MRIAHVARLDLDGLLHGLRCLVQALVPQVVVGQGHEEVRRLRVGLDPPPDGVTLALVIPRLPRNDGQHQVDVGLGRSLCDEPFQEASRPARVLLHQVDGALHQEALLVFRLFLQDEVDLLLGLVHHPGPQEQPPQLQVGKHVLRVQLNGLHEVPVGAAGVTRLHLDHAEHVVGIGVLRVDLDGVLELQLRLRVLPLLVKLLALVEELQLLLLRPRAADSKGQRSADTQAQQPDPLTIPTPSHELIYSSNNGSRFSRSES